MALWTNGTLQPYDKYLGLNPRLGNPNEKPLLESKTKFGKNSKHGRKKNLSQREKEILLKAMALSIQIFAMSCFKLLDAFCKDLGRIMTCFGGAKNKLIEGSIGLVRINFAHPSVMEAWVSKF